MHDYYCVFNLSFQPHGYADSLTANRCCYYEREWALSGLINFRESAHGFVCYRHVVRALVPVASLQQSHLDVQPLLYELKCLSNCTNTPILQVK